MQESKTKEKVLKKIRAALIHKTENRFPRLDFDSDVYATSDEPLEIKFAREFVKVNGHFIFCENEKELGANLNLLIKERGWEMIFSTDPGTRKIFDKVQVRTSDNAIDFFQSPASASLCEFLVARTGSVIVSSRLASGRRGHVFPDHHVVIAYTSQLVNDIKDALNALRNKYGEQIPSLISAITGPSRTADIEKTLVQGAHGPKEIYVFLIDDSTH